VAECESLSDKTFCLVAGLEYRCERDMHILGYSATKLTHVVDPEEVIRHIGSQGAILRDCSSQRRFFLMD
jgi:hypothetical protein